MGIFNTGATDVAVAQGQEHAHVVQQDAGKLNGSKVTAFAESHRNALIIAAVVSAVVLAAAAAFGTLGQGRIGTFSQMPPWSNYTLFGVAGLALISTALTAYFAHKGKAAKEPELA